MVSVILDGFDGAIARLTKTESNFGMYLDSLVDAVAFGLVTSIMIYVWGFRPEYAQIGKVISFVFLSAGIIRLARFNILKEAGAYSINTFIGLPIPLGSISIASIVLIFKELPEGFFAVLLFSVFVILISYLMISNIKYRGLKGINTKYNLLILFLLAILVAFLIMYPSYTIPLIGFSYLISPVFFHLTAKIKKKRAKKKVDG